MLIVGSFFDYYVFAIQQSKRMRLQTASMPDAQMAICVKTVQRTLVHKYCHQGVLTFAD
ncbi:hypothetical protein PARC_a1232 [Pseudoalteromonas arctica A 37-1-2]|uniref:Uncharacterized protein n=1 Tax=Pseudoalteromonas arctica A 37-1-2 TaxID=1117313 RepID=A0A290S4D4_9GAMM|nr:hypothetical protein PARC_a1232 [Pseudoalteromonas arctica A 37-1-2]